MLIFIKVFSNGIQFLQKQTGHFTTFIGFARKYGKDIDVDKRSQELVAFEAEVIQNYGKEETIHG